VEREVRGSKLTTKRHHQIPDLMAGKELKRNSHQISEKSTDKHKSKPYEEKDNMIRMENN
jgi:hypothetical protein